MGRGSTRLGRNMERPWRRLSCRCRIIVCPFSSGNQMDSSQGSCDFGLRISDCGLNLSGSLRVLCVLCGYFLCDALSVSAAPQEVVPVEGPTFSGELISIDAKAHTAFR